MVNTNMEAQRGSWIHCPNPSCEYTWRYLGRFFLYATCPSCRRNVKIEENKIESARSAQVGSQGQTTAVGNVSAEADIQP